MSEMLRPAIRFVLFVVSVAAAVFATMIFLVIAVPEGNDYALGAVIKRERLENTPSPKVVLVGGSNLAYGIDTLAMESLISCPVVNMGMNGYLGVNYMLSEVRGNLNSGDTVVLAFEWDNFFKDIEGTIEQILVIVKVAPDTWGFLDWQQRLRLVTEGVPNVLRQKAERLLGDAMAMVVPRPETDESRELDYILTIENLAGFNAEGDLTSQAGKDWPFGLGEGLDLTGQGEFPEVPVALNSFAREMHDRGVHVVLSYSPMARSLYNKHAAVVAAVHEQMVADGVVDVPRPPQDYVYEDDMFFDEPYHVREEGRLIRTRQLAGDLLTLNGGASPCSPGAADAQ